MNRPTHIWFSFGLCFVVLLAAMGGISWSALRLDDSQRKAEREADLEERVRLALWRMDSSLGILIAEENARPPSDYEAFHVVSPAYSKTFSAWSAGEVLAPSPLLGTVSSNILLHFQFGQDTRLSSPQVPLGRQRTAALDGHINAEELQESEQRLARLQSLMQRLSSSDVAPTAADVSSPFRSYDRSSVAITPPLNCVVVANVATFAFSNENVLLFPEPEPALLQQASNSKANFEVQQALNWNEQKARAQNLSQTDNNQYRNGINLKKEAAKDSEVESRRRMSIPVPEGTAQTNLTVGRLAAAWIDGELVLSRRVENGAGQRTQGCWLNWSALRAVLLASVSDLLPGAGLLPAPTLDGTNPRRLVALPLQIAPGDIPYEASLSWTPIRLTLAVAWAGVVLAGLAVGLLLHGIVALSERRADFVSAVTHELRTPLTTFKMYSEMLAEDMVTDPEQKRHYLGTLKSEANRLGHLVENVLAYAKLERGNARSRVEELTLAQLLERVRERLEQRATQAGMEIMVDADEAVAASRVKVDAGAVEQILFNLVDNACKYAAPSATDRIIHLEALPEQGRFAMLRVRDHGEGISEAGARRLFQPFSKSATEAAHSAPGVGLGLALCRRLSRSLGGDLKRDASVRDGAGFVLSLPLTR
jgi:signal transduction histidine kinase